MAYKLSKYTEFGMEYNYWTIKAFNVFWVNNKGYVDVLFKGYISEEARRDGKSAYTEINQQIPFEVFIKGFTEIKEFDYDGIKSALYTLKDYYVEFKNSEDC